MILYFSGTGNSAYVAKRIAAATGDHCLNLFDKIRNRDYSPLSSDKAFVVVCPTYAWQIPHILRDWLEKAAFSGSSDFYFVMTCGSETGNPAQSLEQLCKGMRVNYRGCAEVVMPENYIALFNAPKEAEARRIIDLANPVIDRTAQLIAAGEPIPKQQAGFLDKVKSSVVNAVFYPAVVHAKKFTVSQACVGCGKCVRDCVLDNVRLEDGRPVWGDNCTHCMACICGCPAKAIEYGRASVGKPRYQCPGEKMI